MALAEKGPKRPDQSPAREIEPTKRYALLSVYDKTGIVNFARVLQDLGYIIISSGGTAKTLTEGGLDVIPVEQITGNPECFDGRMKTISFQIEGGILFDRQNPEHLREASELKIPKIDLVVCNLYPFEETIKKPGVTEDEAIENIDVGGPTMLRAAAKNFKNVLVVIDPADYDSVLEAMRTDNDSLEFRRRLAAKAFHHLSLYDALIARHFDGEEFPNEVTIPGRRAMPLRYGENPHQTGVVYLDPLSDSPLRNLRHLGGREPSLVNVTDINAGVEAVRIFKENAAVVIKHNNPCGIALGTTVAEALSRAIESDPESAFGGVVVVNGPLNLEAAKVIETFKTAQQGQMDIIAGPSINEGALDLLRKVRKTTGIYEFGEIPTHRKKTLDLKFVEGGFILQTQDAQIEDGFDHWKVVTKKKPIKKQLAQMEIAWKFISKIRSNAVIVVDKKLPMTRGIGSGQTSRVRSTKIALEQAGEHAKGAVLASDSFFPFDDSVKLAAKAGIAVIVQQGGSVNDQASITAANDAGITMVFTNRRAFLH